MYALTSSDKNILMDEKVEGRGVHHKHTDSQRLFSHMKQACPTKQVD